VWRQRWPQRKNEKDGAYNNRFKKEVIKSLVRFYTRAGYTVYKGNVFGHMVVPRQAEDGDRLIANPNPPPLATNGSTPSSRRARDENGGIGVSDTELQQLEDRRDYVAEDDPSDPEAGTS
jgi:hypothetical protein